MTQCIRKARAKKKKNVWHNLEEDEEDREEEKEEKEE